MNLDTPDNVIVDILRVNPRIKTAVISTEYGPAVKVQGKGAKYVAGYYTRERYLDGYTDTNWGYVRHGLGHIIPFYENPMGGIV